MQKTKIDWANSVYNPITGCLHGCEYCYARKIANRFGGAEGQNGKLRHTSDALRYKALGNSIALPSWCYVLQRLSICCGANTTMASLFDGIGGFPLIWEYLNGKGSCIWASEIEAFPIAVTRKHFPETK